MKNAVLTSKVEGNSLIIFIVKEGTSVNAGDLVCELDSSVLINKETQQQIIAGKAKAALLQGEEDLKIQKIQNTSEIEAASLRLQLAEIDLEKFQNGDLVQQKNDLESQIVLADENLARAQDSYDFVKRLAKNGYKTQNDLEAERIAVQSMRINKEIIEGKKKLLLEFTEERTLIELKAKVEECRREVERTESRTKSAMIQKEAELNNRKLAFDVENNTLERLRKQIADCKIYATQDGQVVYANTRDGRSQEQVTIDEGVLVRERQAIINLPDLDQMKVNARIHESRINLVHKGMAVQVKVDSQPDHIFTGVVEQVASVPSSTGGFGSSIREYDAVVRILDEAVKKYELRPGLNATVEVLVERRDDVLQIPVQANLTIGNKQFAFVVKDSSVDLRTIKIGKTNSNFIEVIEGIEEGEEVVMNPRHEFEKQIADLEAKESSEQSKDAAKASIIAPPSNLPPATSPGGNMSPPSAGEKPADLANAQRGRGGRERTNGEGAPTGGGQEGRPPGNFDPMDRFNGMDKDHDGKITKAEVEGSRFADRFDTVDTDADGSITKEEFLTSAARFRGGGGPRPAESGGN
jgi:HlyD family secretion protein